MATVPPGKQPINRQRGFSGVSVGSGINGSLSPSGINPMRQRASFDKTSTRNGASIRSFQDSINQPSLPKGFESMLKTTTETGDIGLFSIKPSRLPHTSNALPRRSNGGHRENDLQRSRPTFSPYGVPVVDDRRRLPSYTRKGSSGVKSLYDSASVNSVNSSNRGFEDPDYRSYSMTQTASQSPYILSNQRSYASLRSQQDGSALVQRPRSPFAYPTRLKRPGFRPSSPALTDGGGIDYSRRAEIDRTPYGAVRNVSSPASLYAQKRVPPPLSLRPDANRSTSSLLSQPSPRRRTPSPNLRQGNGMVGPDWQRRNGPPSINTSPARSTLSLSSTTNFAPPSLSQSAANTPGKPSPLYYDYTEDFEVENQNRSNLEPPPQFQLQRTIHEDRPLSSALRPLANSLPSRLNGNNNHHLRASSSASTIIRHPMRKNSAESGSGIPNNGGHVRAALSIGARDCENSAPSNSVLDDASSIDISSLGANAQELSSRVSRAFGLHPSPQFEVTITSGYEEVEVKQTEPTLREVNNMILKSGLQQRSSSLPTAKIAGVLETSPSIIEPQKISTKEYAGEGIVCTPGKQSLESLPDSTELQQPVEDTDECNGSSKFNSARASKVGSSGFSIIGNGLDELADLIATDDAGRSNTFDNEYTGLRRTPMMSPTLPRDSYFDPPSVHRTSPPLSLITKSEQSCAQIVATDKSLEGRLQDHEGQIEKGKIPDYRPSEFQSLGDQAPSKIMPRSESPMLAPKPISPARELKLKNSVPQLMKSLPRIPDSSIRGLAVPGRSALADADVSYHLSKFSPPKKFETIEEYAVSSSSIDPPKTSIEKEKLEKSTEQAELISSPVQKHKINPSRENHGPRSSPMKLKLKVRNSVAEKTSSSDLRARKHETFSWASSQDNNLPLSSQEEQSGDLKPAKLKLKLIRATGSEASGTVRVNNASGDQSRSSNDLHVSCPKDLFTPTSGIDNIFRQVSKHLHSRRPSANSDQQSGGVIEMMPRQLSLNLSSRLNLGVPNADLSGNLPSPTDARSFFSDDSSHRNGGHGLRKRISNFRARVGVPYVARNGSYSCDDIVWRDQAGGVGQSPLAAKSVADLNATRASFLDSPNPRRSEHRLHGHRLRAKVSEWFRGARAAISARVKSRSTTSTGNERSRASA
ncbi:uncharacterized protein Bfra_003883 [Botrytis fragariae]|uniref:Uncharacterized protein n=1 Tax=Botrytis fragariae TaxID=1964551 RepID=A0A8H6EKD1_9HELO|nr:uncharacterized protein Bfra_003883 [Botrytis fragariae]KAF5875429.1 hypothetical protein Bfra_003883 [Botrytis fragariae]